MSGFSASVEPIAIVRGVRAQADSLRTVSVQITVAAATARWESAAAAQFRSRVGDIAVALRAAANDLDDAADLVQRLGARAADPGRPR